MQNKLPKLELSKNKKKKKCLKEIVCSQFFTQAPLNPHEKQRACSSCRDVLQTVAQLQPHMASIKAHDK
jgi:hypothetical protein